MKYLIVLVVVLVVFWYWRRASRASRADPPPQDNAKPVPPQQQDMVQCPVCLVHLPRSDALPGRGGQLYCCAEHRVHAGN